MVSVHVSNVRRFTIWDAVSKDRKESAAHTIMPGYELRIWSRSPSGVQIFALGAAESAPQIPRDSRESGRPGARISALQMAKVHHRDNQ